MLAVLLQLHSVLTSDLSLIALVPSANIGAIIRQDAGSPSLEYGIDGDQEDHSGHRLIILTFTIVSASGAEETAKIKERLEQLLTAKIMSTPVSPSVTPLIFNVAQIHLSDSRVLPKTNWAHSLLAEFTLRVADKRPKTQKQ